MVLEYIVFSFLVITNFMGWSFLFIIYAHNKIEQKLKGGDGTFFCRSCHCVTGKRSGGLEYNDGLFVASKDEEVLPPNVVSFRPKN